MFIFTQNFIREKDFFIFFHRIFLLDIYFLQKEISTHTITIQ